MEAGGDSTDSAECIISTFRRDKTMTALLTGIVLVLIICHTPKTIINVYESYQVEQESPELRNEY